MNIHVNDMIQIKYKGSSFVVKVIHIKLNIVYVRDVITNTDSSLTWDNTTKRWILSNDDKLEQDDVALIKYQNKLPEAEANFSFTGRETTDIEMLKFVSIKDFNNVCNTSKYSVRLCNGFHNNVLYKERMQRFFPKYYEIFKEEIHVNWRALYWRAVSLQNSFGYRISLDEKDFPMTLDEMKLIKAMRPYVLTNSETLKNVIEYARREEDLPLLLWYVQYHLSNAQPNLGDAYIMESANWAAAKKSPIVPYLIERLKPITQLKMIYIIGGNYSNLFKYLVNENANVFERDKIYITIPEGHFIIPFNQVNIRPKFKKYLSKQFGILF